MAKASLFKTTENCQRESTSRVSPPNSTLKLSRPGFGPALKRLGRTPASRRHVGCIARRAIQRYTRATALPQGIKTWALAVQLSARAVGLTKKTVASPADCRRVRDVQNSVLRYLHTSMIEMSASEIVKWLQPYAVLVSAILSVAALGFLVNILRLSREAAADRIKVFEDRLAGAKEERERDEKERDRDEKWFTREKERLERELANSRSQLEKLLAGAGLDLPALALGEGLRTLTDDIKKQLNTLTDELERRLKTLPPVLEDARAQTQLAIAKANMAVGRWRSAAAQLDEYSVHDAPDWEAQFSRGVAHANAREGVVSDIAALRAYNEAIALAPADLDHDYRARLHGYRGAILKRLRRLAEAEADLTIARGLATAAYEVADTQYNFACVFAMRGDRMAMLQTVRQLLHAPSHLAAIRGHLHDYFVSYQDDPELLELIAEKT